VLGVVAFLIAWIPFIGTLGMPLSALGALLATVGLWLSLLRGGARIGFPIAGGATCLLALAVGWTSTHAVIDMLTRDRTSPTNQKPLDPTATQHEDAWIDGFAGVKQGDASIRILNAHVGKVPLASYRGNGTSRHEFFVVQIQIANTSGSRKIDYSSWAHDADLSDEFGNTYRYMDPGYGTSIDGQLSGEAIYPGQSVEDLLAYEPPVATATEVRLELPAKNFGGTGKLRLKLPRDRFSDR